MTTSDGPMGWALAVAGAAAVAALYFAGLWWTVQRAAGATRPVLLLAASFLVRGVAAAALLLVLAGGDPWRLMAAAGAFLAVRTLVVWRARTGAPFATASRRLPVER